MAKKQSSKKPTKKTKVSQNEQSTAAVSQAPRNAETEVKSTLSKNKMSFILGILVFLLLAGAFYLLNSKWLVAAYVNGEPISRLTVINELEKQGGSKVVDQLVTEKLIEQEANKRKVTVSQKEVDEEMKKIEANVKEQGMTLEQAMQIQGISKDQLVKEVKIQLMLQKMLKKPEITDKQVTDYITANKDNLGITDENQATLSAQIKDQLGQQQQQEDIQKFLDELKKNAKIKMVQQY
jgi:foldase protein PrsA